MYRVEFAKPVQRQLKKLQKESPLHIKKVVTFVEELRIHPKSGTGKPEPLKGGKGELWSRRISQKHRLIYEIKEEVVSVLVLSAYGHYSDK